MPNETDELVDVIMASLAPQMPSMDQLRGKLKTLADERGDWAGIPMILGDLDLVLEPKYPYQFHLDRNCNIDETASGNWVQVVNRWWSERYRCHVCLCKDDQGKRSVQLQAWNGGMMVLNTIGASRAWSFQAEVKAQQKLKELVTPHIFEMYIMTGSFLETSKRSGITYIFRRLRPTVALSNGHKGKDVDLKILCTLCAHSIGYYKNTWGGAMTPTDDVVSHLLWMRGDEPKFWQQSNQHPANQPQSGL